MGESKTYYKELSVIFRDLGHKAKEDGAEKDREVFPSMQLSSNEFADLEGKDVKDEFDIIVKVRVTSKSEGYRNKEQMNFGLDLLKAGMVG